MHRETYFDVAKTLSIRQLGECHRKKLLPAAELANSMISIVAVDASSEIVVREVFDDLGKDGSTTIHCCSTPPAF